MNKIIKLAIASASICLSTLFFISPAFALTDELEGNDLYVNGYSSLELFALSNTLHLLGIQDFFLMANLDNYTKLDAENYQQVVMDARNKISNLIEKLKPYRTHDLNEQITLITQQLADSAIPYITAGAMGEGDWQPDSSVYKGGAVHIIQDPVYRLDGLNCQTLVQVAMALLHANNLDDFDQHFLNVAYGAAGNPNNEIVHFYNRNNFISADFNPVNQKNNTLVDGTASGVLLSGVVKTTSTTITRQNWFKTQLQNTTKSVRVLSTINGQAMVNRVNDVYTELYYPYFYSEPVSLTYIPKEQLAIKQANGSYQPNQTVLDQIAVPAVIEIVRDTKKWNIGTKNIKDIIGSELDVSHVGILYRQTFKRGETIFQKIACRYSLLNDGKQQKVCDVTPVLCQKEQCSELMFAQATSAYPDGYYWYAHNGVFVCSPDKPTDVNIASTTCNRVERLPLSDYITRQQYANHPFMDTDSIIGIHVEKLI